MKARIMVVDDEESLVRLITHNLHREGFETIAVYDGAEVLDRIRLEEPDLVILDLMLPGKNGLEICRELREGKDYTPILMLTARDEEIDRVLGLEIGADDYVTKPFSVRELIARVKAILRRHVVEPADNSGNLESGGLVVRPGSYEVFLHGQKIDLTLKEFELLEMLVRNKGRVLKRDYLLRTLWGYGGNANTRVLDVHISKLREKIGAEYIRTIRGIGYKFEENFHE